MLSFNLVRWFKSLFHSRVKTLVKRPSFFLRMEELETRLAPALYTWSGAHELATGGVANTWNDAGNWKNGLIPVVSPTTPVELQFDNTGYFTNPNVDNLAGLIIDQLTIASGSYTITGLPFELGSPSANQGTITVNSGIGNETITNNIQLGSAAASTEFLQVQAASTLTLSGQLTGNSSTLLTQKGPGTLTLTDNNSTFAGPYTISDTAGNGTTVITDPNALGTNTVTITANTQLQVNLASGSALANPLVISASGPNGIDGAVVTGPLVAGGTVKLAGGSITMNANSTIGVENLTETLEIDDVISDANISGYSLTKEGPGTLFLNPNNPLAQANNFDGGNMYHGNTFVNGGMLQIGQPFALGVGGATTIVNSNNVESGTLSLNYAGNKQIPAADLVYAQVQTVTFTGAPQFTLSYNGVSTLPITYSGTMAGTVAAALNGLSTIGGIGASVTVTQTGTVLYITFGGSLGGLEIPTVSATVTSGSGTATVASTTGNLLGQNPIGFIVPDEILTLNGPGLEGIHANFTNNALFKDTETLPGGNTTTTGALANTAGDNSWEQTVNLWSTLASIGQNVEPDFHWDSPNLPRLVSPATIPAVAIGASAGTNLTIDGVITDNGLGAAYNAANPPVFPSTINGYSLAKVGAGRLILTADNTFTGNVDVITGELNIRDSNALGSLGSSNYGHEVWWGASLELQADGIPDSGTGTYNLIVPLSANPNILLSGPGANGEGALDNISGVNIIDGDISLLSDEPTTTIGVAPDPDPTNIQGDTWNDLSQLTINGVITAPLDETTLTKTGYGELVLTNENTYIGPESGQNTYQTFINQGWITAENDFALGGTLGNRDPVDQPGVQVLPGAALVLKQDPAGNSLTVNYNLSLSGSGMDLPSPLSTLEPYLNEDGALESLDGANTETGNIYMDGIPIQFEGALGNAAQNLMTANYANLTTPFLGGAYIGLDIQTLGTSTNNEVQILDFSGNVNGGTFTLTFGASTTAAIAWSANDTTLVANIQAALTALLGANNVVVGGTNPVAVGVETDGANSPTFPSQLTLTGTLSDPYDNLPNVAPPISSQLDKVGSQRLILQGVGVYSGGVDIQVGVLRIENDDALGTSTNSTSTFVAGNYTTTVENGAALEMSPENPLLTGGNEQGLQIWNDNLVLNGSGDATFGDAALTVLSNDNLWRGPITLNSDINVAFSVPNSAFFQDATLTMSADSTNLSGGSLTVADSTPGGSGLSAVQTLNFSSSVVGGTFTLTVSDSEQQTLTVAGAGTFGLAFTGYSTISTATLNTTGLTASGLASALNTLLQTAGAPGYVSATSYGTATVTGTGPYLITLGGTLAGTIAPLLIAQGATGTAIITPAYVSATTAPITWSASPPILVNNIQTALNALQATFNVNTFTATSIVNVSLSTPVIDVFPNTRLTVTGSVGDSLNPADLNVTGTGELALAGANTYRGTTYVNEGVLTISNPKSLGGTGISAVQVLTFSGAGAGTTFNLAFPDGSTGTLYTTPSINYTGVGATDAAAIQTALNNLHSIGGAGGAVTVTAVSNVQFDITFNGNFIGFSQPNLQTNITGGSGTVNALTQTAGAGGTVVASGAQLQLQGGIDVNGEPIMIQGQGDAQESELQLISAAGSAAGTFTLGFTNPTTQLLSTTTLSVGATAAQVQTALDSLTSVQQGGTGTGGGTVIVTQTGVGTYEVLFGGTFTGAQQSIIVPAQILAVSGTSGTFTLTLGSSTTAALAYNVPATGGVGPTGSIQNALNAILAASGSPGYVNAATHGDVASITVNADGSFTIFFGGTLSEVNVPIMLPGAFTGSTVATVNATGVTVFTTELVQGGSANATPTQFFTSGPSTVTSGAVNITTVPATNTANLGGPVTSIAVDPFDGNIIYITTAGGGAWKTTNDGTTWTPLFDGVSTVQTLTITGSDATTDTFTLTYTSPTTGATAQTVTLPYNATADQLQAALNGIVGTGNSVSVSQNINTNGVNEVQEIVLNTSASTWTSETADPIHYTRYFLTFRGQQSAAIPYMGNAAEDQIAIQTALDSLSTIGGRVPTAGSVNVSVDPTPPGGLGALTDEGFTITFQGALADAPEPLITFAMGAGVGGGGGHGHGGGGAGAQFWSIAPGGSPNPPSPFPTINDVPAVIIGPNPPNTTNNSDSGSLAQIQLGAGPTIIDTVTFSGGGLANVNVALMTATPSGATTIVPAVEQQGVGAQAAMFSSSIVVGGYGEPAAPTDNILFLGTGVDNDSEVPFYGTGVYESTDFGQTWNLLQDTTLAAPNPIYGMSVNKIVLDPSNDDLYVATSDVGTSTDAGIVSAGDTPTVRHPGIWRYNLTTGSWLDLTDITSTNRLTVASANVPPPGYPYGNPPMNPGPDDNYLLAFPQTNGSWSDLAITTNPNDGGVYLYAALGTTGANAANGVYTLVDPATVSVAAPPAWWLGDPVNGVDSRSATQFPTAAGPNYFDDPVPNSFFNPFTNNDGDIGSIKLALITGTNGATLFPFGGGGGTANPSAANPTAADFLVASASEAGDANNPFPNEAYFLAGSADSAQDWGGITPPPANWLGSAGNHDSALLVTSTDIYVGGSDPSGDTYIYDYSGALGAWVNISTDAAGNGPHTGVNSFAFLGTTLYVGTEGGMWTYNTTTDLWTDINGNLADSGIYDVASDPTNPNIVFGGGVGTGVVEYTGNENWTQVESNINTTGNLSTLNTGSVAVDPNNSQNVYAIYAYGGTGNGGSLTVSTSGGAVGTWSTVYTDPTDSLPIMTVDSFSRVFVGGSALMLSTNQGGSFINLAAPAGNITAIAVADLQGPFGADPSFPTVTDLGAQNPVAKTLAIVENNVLYVTKDLGVTWVNRNAAAWGGHAISDVAIDPTNRDDMWVTLGGAVGNALTGTVWFSSNAGRAWTNESTGLAAGVPGRAIAIDPRNGTVYLGTDLGVYILAPGAVRTWARFGVGSIPMVSVVSLNLNQSSNILTVGTAGRGVFQFYIDTPAADAGALVATSGTDIWNGPVVLAGPATISAIGNQDLQNAVAVTELTLLGLVSDSTYAAATSGSSTLTKSGTGDVLISDANTYSGVTLINEGDVTVGNPTALGGGAITSAQELFLAGAVAGSTQFTLSFNGAGPSAAITYTGLAADATAIQTQLAALIPGTATVAVSQITPGDYLIVFGGSLAGNTTLVTSTVTAGLGSAFAAADGTTVVTSGAGLLLDSSLTGEPLYLFGNGAENQSGHYSGAVENASGANTYTGTITLENNSTIAVDGTSALTIASPAVGTPAITDLGAAGAFGVQKEGSGTLTLISSNNYQGGTTVNQGVLNVQNNSALGLAGSTTTVLDGAQLQLQSFTLAGLLTSGTNTITGLPTTVGLAFGQTVAGLGIPAGTTITLVGPGNQVTLSQNATASGVASIMFGSVAVTTQNLSLSGTGILNTGALENVGGSNTWGSAATTITLSAVPGFSPESAPGDVTIGVLNAGESLTLGSVITQTPSTVTSAPALSLVSGLTKVGLGKLILTQNDTYSGTNYVNNGILDIQNSGALGTANGNEIQRITTRDPGGADSFMLSFGGSTTTSIPFGATATQVANALNGLGTIGAGGVTVAENDVNSGISQVETETLTNLTAGNTIKWTFGAATTAAIPYTDAVGTQIDALAVQNALNSAFFATIGGLTPFAGSVSVVANYTDTVFTVTFGGYLADHAQVFLTGVPAAGSSVLQAGAAVVTSDANTGVGFPTLVYTVTFSGAAYAGKPQALIAATPSVPGLTAVVSEVALGNAGTNVANGATLQLDGDSTHSGIPGGIAPNQILDIYGYGQTTLTTTGNISAGTFTLKVGTQTTGSINASLTGNNLATAVQTALGVLSNVGVGNVSVLASPTNNAYTIAFSSSVATPVVYLTSSGIVGGTIAVTTPGALENLSGNNTWAGAIVLPTSSAVSADAIGVDPTSTLTVTGTVQDPTTAPLPPNPVTPATLAKVGGGVLILPNANTYAGSNYIDAGAIDIGNVGSLGTNNSAEQTVTVSGTSGTFTLGFVGYGIGVTTPAVSITPTVTAATLQTALNSATMLGNAAAPGGGTGLATVTALSSGNEFVITFGGSLAGFSVPLLRKISSTNNANAVVGQLLVGASSATYVDSAALGGSGHASLQLPVSIPATATTFKPVTINGPGYNSAGALESISGIDTVAVPITLGSTASIGADSGSQLTLTDPISDGGAGYGVNIVSKSTPAGAPGTGIVEFNATAANAYTGTTTVVDGKLELADGVSGGAVLSTLDVGVNTAIDQVQQIALSGFSSNGVNQFTLTYGSTTLPITYYSNSTYEAAQIQAALNLALAPISVTVVSPSANVFNVAFGGSIAGTNPATLLSGTSASGTITNNGILTTGAQAQANAAEAQLLASNQINPASTVTVQGDGLFDLNDKSQTIAGLSVLGVIGAFGTATTGASGAGGGALTVTGVVQLTDGSLNTPGPGDLVTVNGAAGALNVDGGTVNEPGTGSKVNVTGPVNISGGTINISGLNSQFNDTGVLSQSAGAIDLSNTNSQLNVIGSMFMTNAANLIVGGTNDAATITGPLSEIDSSAIIGGSNSEVTITGLYTVIGTDVNGTFNLFGPTAKLFLDGNVTANSDATGAADIFGTGTVVLNDATTPLFTVNHSGLQSSDLVISAAITGSQGMTKAGAGQLELDAADNYGTTTINAGNVLVDQLGIQTVTLNGFTAGQKFNLTYTNGALTGQTLSPITYFGDATGTNTAASILSALQNLMTFLGLPNTDVAVATTGTPNIFTITYTAAAALELIPMTGAPVTPATGTVSVVNVNDTGAIVLNGGNISGKGTVGSITGPASPAPTQPPTVNLIDPGNNGVAADTGILQVNGAVNLGAGTTLYVDLDNLSGSHPNPIAGSDYDQLDVNGNVTLGGALLSGSITSNDMVGDTYTILTVTPGHTITGNLSGILNGVQTTIPTTNGYVFFGTPQEKFSVTYNPTSIVLSRVLKNVTIVITPVPSTLNPSIYGQDVPYVATITAEPGAGNLPSGPMEITFTFDKATLGATVNFAIPAGVSTYTTPQFDPENLYGSTYYFTPGSANTIDAAFTDVYSGTPQQTFNNATAAELTQSVNKNSANILLTSTPAISSSSPTYGQNVTVTATITPHTALTLSGAFTPTGNATFTLDGTTTYVAPISNLFNMSSSPTATWTIPANLLTVGVTHTVTVSYNGDTYYSASVAPVQLSVTIQKNSSSVAVTATPVPSIGSTFGQTATFTATVTANAPGTLGVTPSGTVSFYDGNAVPTNLIGTGTLVNGAATVTTSTLSVFTHTINVIYNGDNNYTGSNGSLLYTVNAAPTSTSFVSESPNPSNYGASVVLTANVVPNPGINPALGLPVPTGLINFWANAVGAGGVFLGSGTVSASGSASATTPALALVQGTHSLFAVYAGDSNYVTSTGTYANFLVNPALTTTTLTATPVAGSSYGQAITLTAAITFIAGTPTTGSVSFVATNLITSAVTPLGTANVNAQGKAILTPSIVLPAAGYSISASYTDTLPDTNFGPSTGGIASYTVSQSSTTTVVTATPSSNDVFGETVTFTATINPVAPGAGTPADGTLVTFKDGSIVLGTGSTISGKATYTTANLTVGFHNITAIFPGDANFTNSTGTLSSYSVGKATSSTVLTSNPATGDVVGEPVTFTATVTAVAPGIGVPTDGDLITFKDGLNVIGTGTLASGVATFTLSSLTVGTHSISAVFPGDANFNTSTGTIASYVIGKAQTTTTVTANPATGDVFGESVTITAAVTAVSPGSGTPANGDVVTFKDGAVTLGSGTLTGGQAVFSLSNLAVGVHTITASFAGDANYVTSAGNLNNLPSNNYTVSAAPTVTTVSVSPASGDIYGQPVTLTANVAVVSPGAGTPANGDTVAFKDNGVIIGTGTLSGGQTSFVISTLNAGIHSITATYLGDTNFATSTGLLNGSAVNNYTVGQASTTTGLSASPSSNDTYGQSVTLTASVTVNYPGVGTPSNGDIVTFLDGVAILGTGTLNNGLAFLTTSSLIAGTHTITASFGGDTNYATSSGALNGITANNFTVNQANTLTTLTATPVNGDVSGEAVTFTAAVNAVAPGAGVPANGDVVTFKDGSTTLGNGFITNGVATFTTSALGVGTHSISATFVGDGNFATSAAGLNGNPFNNYTIGQDGTTTTVTSSPASGDVYGESVTFTASIAANAPGAGTPNNGDTITFKDGGTTIGTASLVGGVATYTTSTLIVGSHTISASFSGDTNFTASMGSLNNVSFNNFVVTVASTTTTLTASPASGDVVGQSASFTAAVSAVAPGVGAAANGDLVTFKDGGTTLGTATTSGGIAIFNTSSLAVGVHTITATFAGDGNLGSSSGNLFNVPLNNYTVNKASTTTTVTASPATTIFGQAVHFTAVVTANAPGNGTPANGDLVTFYDGGVSIGTGTLSGGVATFATSSLIVGIHSITATFAGDSNYVSSTGGLNNVAVNNFTVTQPLTTTTVSANPSSTVFGQPVTFTANIAVLAPGIGQPANGDTVNFFDAGNPIGSGTLSGGVATITTTSLGAGVHSISATFIGDANFEPSSGNLNNVAVNNFTVTADAVSTSVTASPASGDVFGNSVTFTATLTAVSPGSGTPADGGVVTFKDGSTTLGTGILVGGVATFTTGSLAVGSHNITANFPGDPNFAASTGALNNYAVVNAGTVTLVSATPASGDVYGRPVSLTATVTSATTAVNGGTVSFYNGTPSAATLLGTSSAVVNGSATITTVNTALPVSSGLTITAVYSGAANIAGNTGALTSYAVAQASTTTIVTSSSPISGFGQTVTFTANVTANSPSTATVSSGTVTFKDGAATIGTANVTNGVATLSTSALAQLPATHSITAIYNLTDVGNFATSTSAAIAQTVLGATTTTVVSTAANPTQYGQAIPFTVTVTGNAGAPTGTVNLYDGPVSPANLIAGPLALVGGTVSGALPTLNVGGYTVNAVYSGETNVYAPSSGSMTRSVNPSLTATALSVSPLSASTVPVYGQAVSLTAVVTAAFGGNPTSGVVTFTDATTNATLGSASLSGSNSVSITTTALTAATHTITATYAGITNDASSNGSVLNYTVHQATTTTGLVSTAPNSVYGQPVTFSATVIANSPSTVNPTFGTVSFKDGTTVIASVTLNGSNTATFTTSTLAVATHSITATYNANANYAASTASAVSQVVGKATTTTAVTASVPGGSQFGQSVTFTASITLANGSTAKPTGTVKFLDGAVVLATVTLSGTSNIATYTTAALAVNPSHTITAVFTSSNANITSSSGSLSPYSVTPAITTTTLTSSPANWSVGTPISFTAIVASTGGGAIAAGTVTFVDTTTNQTLGSGKVVNGKVVISFAGFTSAGIHSVVANYSGTANLGNSSSTALTQNIVQVTLASSANPALINTAVTFTATVTGAGGTPTGTVSFYDGTKLLGTTTLNVSGVAAFTISTLAAGTHKITAVYNGDATFSPGGTPTALTETVETHIGNRLV